LQSRSQSASASGWALVTEYELELPSRARLELVSPLARASAWVTEYELALASLRVKGSA
jgi:hypothetical protein